MRASRSLGQLATMALSLAPLASAWPSWLPALDSLVVRQDNGESSTTPAPTETPASGGTSKSKSAPNTFNLNTGTQTSTEPTVTGGSGKNSTKTTGGAKHTQFDPQSPAGSVVMISPAITEGSQLYKIGDPVTWSWNYTNLQGTPTAVDLYASCSVATRTYTLTQNMTFATQGTYTWDTDAFQNDNKATPLLTEQYTLILFDAESSVSATPEAGYLGTFTNFRFGMYEPKKYTPLGEWSCASCNSAAISDMDRRALGFALTMSLITVTAFTWFVTGLGLGL